MNVTEAGIKEQKLICKKFILLSTFLAFATLIVSLFIISSQLEVIGIYINESYIWLSLFPLIIVYIFYFRGFPLVFDWMGLYVLGLPFGFLFFISSLTGIYVSLPSPENFYASGLMILGFLLTLIVRTKAVDYKNIKKNLLKYYVDSKICTYSPMPKQGGVGKIYKKNKSDSLFKKIQIPLYWIVIYLGPIFVGASISTSWNGRFKMTLFSLFCYLVVIIAGIPIFHLCYARLKCLYEIQRELGCKLRFGD